jgi:rare lipoprotein A
VRTLEWLTLALLSLLLLTSCAHKKARVEVPPPPSTAETQTRPAGNLPASPPLKQPQAETSATESEDEVISLPADAQPVSTETGMASWYGAPYHNRTGSNGKVYNMHAMTAAHRTLPLGSVVRVTNLKTGHSALLRITDRGPFVAGRIVDLSYAAAKQLDVWQPGVANVKVEVMQTPASMATGGRWAVQIGSFENQKEATELADHLARRYHTAKVAKFASPVGDWWVRVRVLHDDRKRAEAVIRETTTATVAAYLVRLD